MSDDDLRPLYEDQDEPKSYTEDSSDADALREKQTRILRELEEGKQFWANALATDVGRRELWRILEAAGTFKRQFACGPSGFPQPEATWFAAGQQELGSRLYHSWTRLDRAGVFKMLDEHDPRFAVPQQPERSTSQ